MVRRSIIEALANVKGISYDEAWMIIMEVASNYNDVMQTWGSNNVREIEIR